MKSLILLFSLSIFIACGKSNSGKQLADEVCECSKKANALPTSDASRTKQQDDCMVKQREAWDKVKADKEESLAFNNRLSECANEQIRNSIGQ